MAASSPSSPSPPSCAGFSPARASTSGTSRSTSCPCGASPSRGSPRARCGFWNPFVHEGVPLSLPALGYPIDLLQLLRPDEAGLSAILALHVPLAALAFFALARGLSLGRVAAVGGGVVYALGGFLLSSLNLYVYLQAAAWAPLLVLGLVRVLGGGSRRAAGATAVVLAVALSTTGVEIVAQALVCRDRCSARAGGGSRGAAAGGASRWGWAWAWRSRRRSCCSSRARWRAARAGRVSRRTSCSPTRSTRSLSSRRSSAGSTAT